MVIPDHNLLLRIGEGGFGEVWLARTVTDKFRAVKIIHRQRFERDGISAAGADVLFRLEFEGVKKFENLSRRHEGLIFIQTVGMLGERESFFYVMPLADDLEHREPCVEESVETYEPLTLESLIRADGRLSIERAREILREVASATAELHCEGLAHRDLKSANVLFIEGRPVVGDPGLISVESESLPPIAHGFSPPEGHRSAASDVFSLGRIYYHMVSGKHPADDYPFLPPELLEAEGASEAIEILDKCGHPDEEEQFRNAGDLYEHLVSLDPSAAPRLRTKGRLFPILAAGLVLILAAGAIGWVKGKSSWKEFLAENKLRGLMGSEPLISHTSVWDYAVVSDLDELNAELEWQKGRSPFVCGHFPHRNQPGISFVDGKHGKAVHFENPNAGVFSGKGYVELPPISSPVFTVAFWLKLDGDALCPHEAVAYSVGWPPMHRFRITVDNNLEITPSLVAKKNTSDPKLSYKMPVNEWRHVAVVVGKAQMSLYIDGQPLGTTDLRARPKFPLDGGAPQFLAHHRWEHGRATRLWGAIDEFRSFERALTVRELQGLVSHPESHGPGDLHFGTSFEEHLEDISGKGGVAFQRSNDQDFTDVDMPLDGSKLLVLRTAVESPIDLPSPFIDLNCRGHAEVEIDGVLVPGTGLSSDQSDSPSVSGMSRLDVSPISKGKTTRVRVFHQPAATDRNSTISLRLHDYSNQRKSPLLFGLIVLIGFGTLALVVIRVVAGRRRNADSA